jgi:glycerol uptake facilitator-like aquaporin
VVKTQFRLCVAEFIGAAFLVIAVIAVIGSGIAATRLSPGDVGLQLLESSVATGAALIALILAMQPVSAAFNPVLTLVERAAGLLDTATAAAVIAAQIVGGVVGAVTANLMFGRAAVSISTDRRATDGHLLGEFIATLGLVLIVLALARSGRAESIAYAVAGYIISAYWFTSSTSFANPAVTVARSLTNTFAGIAPASVPTFVLVQLLGAGVGYAVVCILYPRPIAKETTW